MLKATETRGMPLTFTVLIRYQYLLNMQTAPATWALAQTVEKLRQLRDPLNEAGPDCQVDPGDKQ